MRKPMVFPPRRRKDRKGHPWVVVYIDQNGRRRQEQFGIGEAGKERAHDRAAELRGVLRQAGPATRHDPNVTLKVFAEGWIHQEGLATEQKRGLKRNTILTYRNLLDTHIYPWGAERRVRDIHATVALEFLQGLLLGGKLKESSVKMVYGLLRRVLEQAKFERVIVVNPISNLWKRMPRRRKQQVARTAADIKALSRGDVRKLLDASIGVERVLFETQYAAALRVGELVGLQIPDVDLAVREINVQRNLMRPVNRLTLAQRVDSPKGGLVGRVEISPRVAEVLRQHIAARLQQNLKNAWTDDRALWLFVNDAGKPFDQALVRWRFARILKRAGISSQYTPHGLRHSYATHMLNAGASLVWVAKQLRHASPKITLDRYAWAIPSESRGFVTLLESAPETVAVGGSSGGSGGGQVTRNDHSVTEAKESGPQVVGFATGQFQNNPDRSYNEVTPTTPDRQTEDGKKPERPVNSRPRKGGGR